MDKLLSKEALDLFFLFVVPGVIAHRTYSLVSPGENKSLTDRSFELITFSLVHVTFFHGLYAQVVELRSPLLARLAQLGMVVVLPALEAYLWFWTLKWRWFRELLHIPHPAPKAWDYVFTRSREYFVLLTLKSGERIGGLYGRNSFTSSFPHPEQIFIEQVWRLEDDNFINPVESSAGAIIPFADCNSIELFEPKEQHHVERQVPEEERRIPACTTRESAEGTVAAVVAAQRR